MAVHPQNLKCQVGWRNGKERMIGKSGEGGTQVLKQDVVQLGLLHKSQFQCMATPVNLGLVWVNSVISSLTKWIDFQLFLSPYPGVERLLKKWYSRKKILTPKYVVFIKYAA